jgi:acyl-CoA reductase-like NAD-dependent aldehyde dehydrogenase
VVKRTADRLARTALELGGKSPAIIAEDVDMDEVMATLGVGSTGFMGQVCVSLSRVLAPRRRYDEVVDAMASHFSSLRIGDPFDAATDRGPLAVERARDRVESHVATARAQGARVVAGGRRPAHLNRGWFYPTTASTTPLPSPMIPRSALPVRCTRATWGWRTRWHGGYVPAASPSTWREFPSRNPLVAGNRVAGARSVVRRG